MPVAPCCMCSSAGTQAAIVLRKQELAVEQVQLQAALDAGVVSGIDPLDDPDIQPDIKVGSCSCLVVNMQDTRAQCSSVSQVGYRTCSST